MPLAARKFRFLKSLTSTIGLLVKPFPNHERNKSGGRKDCKSENETRAEPVVLLPFIEHHLQGADAEREQGDSDVVNFQSRAREALYPRGIFDEAKDQEQRQNADRQIDEENPAPGVVIRDPSAEGRSDRRRDDCGDAVEREGQTALFGRESVRQDCLGHGLKPATADPLQNPKEDDGSEAWRDPTQKGAQSENYQTDHEKPFAAECSGKPSADGQHDGIRHEIGSEHPGALIVARAETAGHVGERDIGDARVEHLHESRHRDDNRNQPWVESGLPHGGRRFRN